MGRVARRFEARQCPIGQNCPSAEKESFLLYDRQNLAEHECRNEIRRLAVITSAEGQAEQLQLNARSEQRKSNWNRNGGIKPWGEAA
jgi:hypothetical protein